MSRSGHIDEMDVLFSHGPENIVVEIGPEDIQAIMAGPSGKHVVSLEEAKEVLKKIKFKVENALVREAYPLIRRLAKHL